MGKTLGVKATDAEWEMRKLAWRAAHPKIVQTWREIQNAAIDSVRNPGEKRSCGYPGRQATFRVVGSFLWCLLPSGRAICFPYPKLLNGEYGEQLTYMSKPGPDKTDIIADPKNVSNWARVSTYGGSLLNNINQGLCRDFLADGLLALDEKGAAIVLHTHDSISIETDTVKAEGARNAMENILCTPPVWAAGFPLVAGCDVESRFRG
jgi:DNA polymerase